MRLAKLLAIPALVFCGSTAAHSDGMFLQMDLSPETADAVVAGTRGKLSFGANYSGYEDGWSAGAFVSRDFVLPDIGTLKVGPSVGIRDDRDDLAFGAKVVAERYQPTSFGFMFLSAQYNTIDSDWFALVQVGNNSGLYVDLSAGGSDTYSERSIALNRKLGDGPVSVRAGYRFLAEEVFLGFSINTF